MERSKKYVAKVLCHSSIRLYPLFSYEVLCETLLFDLPLVYAKLWVSLINIAPMGVGGLKI